jgi:DNA-binding NarL/FixJ family response regulator
MRFYNDEWNEFVENCGFTDDELRIVALLRRGWFAVDIGEELGYSRRTIERRKKSIKSKILRWIERQK